MKRVMLLAAMLAMALMAAAPALAQDAGDAVADDGSQATGGDVSVQYVDCSQVQAQVQAQGQYGDASASGDASSAEISQELGITQSQVNACLGNIGGTAAPTAIPQTGGASLFALGGGILLVAGGLLARRIIR